MKSTRGAQVLAGSALLLGLVAQAIAQNWILTTAPVANWTSVASSADGHHLLANSDLGTYVSTDSGVSWQLTNTFAQAYLASSADGTVLAAAVPFSGITISSNSGTTWTVTAAPQEQWSAIACSADGRKLAGAVFGYGISSGTIFTSTNQGATWTQSDVRDWFRSLASSADGNRMLATAYYQDRFGSYGATYASVDAGASWSMVNPSYGTAVASSAEASKLFLARFNSGIQKSRDAGVAWADTSAPPAYWSSVACSADGSKVIAVAGGWFFNYTFTGSVYTSSDSGVSWASNNLPALAWQSVASSADGCKLVAVVHGGGIYTWQTTPTPVLNITNSGSNLLLSWLVPSMNFVLQETGDLAIPNWTDVTAEKALNYTNLNYEVTVPVPSGNRFYRLLMQ